MTRHIAGKTWESRDPIIVYKMFIRDDIADWASPGVLLQCLQHGLIGSRKLGEDVMETKGIVAGRFPLLSAWHICASSYRMIAQLAVSSIGFLSLSLSQT